jgi:hypothetical protein
MGSEMNWWDSSDFSAFLPFIQGRPANDKRRKKHMRLELKAPWTVTREALVFQGGCASCNEPIYPFRARKTASKTVYVAVTCPLETSIGCARTRAASNAYDAIEAMLR